jgi:hypothetical protein
VTGQVADVAERRVAAVEQPLLVQFVGSDVGDEPRADGVEGRALVAEVVLDDPLGEGLRHHRPAVPHPELPFQRPPVPGIGLGGDPVHHAAREGDVLRDPPAELNVAELGEGHDRVSRGAPVVREVVAGEDGEGCDPSLTAQAQRLGEVAGDRSGPIWIAQVGGDLGLRGIELAVGVDAVAATGDGEGDELGSRVRQRPQDGCRFLRPVQVVEQGPDDPRVVAVAVALQHGVEAVLSPQRVPDLAAAQPDPDHTPLVRDPPLGEVVEINTLVGPVEAADADMDHTGKQRRAVVGRCAHPWRGAARGLGEAAASAAFFRMRKFTNRSRLSLHASPLSRQLPGRSGGVKFLATEVVTSDSSAWKLFTQGGLRANETALPDRREAGRMRGFLKFSPLVTISRRSPHRSR